MSRAHRHVDAERARFSADREEHARLTARFARAVGEGDVEALVEMLAADAAAYTDGGGKVQAARKPIHGREKVMRFLAKSARVGLGGGLRIEAGTVNGRPGLLAVAPDGAVAAVMVLDVAGGQVQVIRVVANPDKLAHLPRR